MSKHADFTMSLGGLSDLVDEAVARMENNRVAPRIWEKDHTVWKEDPKEISNRLGWLDSPESMKSAVEEISVFVDKVRGMGITRALLLGMGGSSLAPDLFGRVFGPAPGYVDVKIIDSTDPGAVLSAAKWAEPDKTLFIISTKSGTTVETFSFAKYFYSQAKDALGAQEAGKHFAAITDPGSKLDAMAKDLGFLQAFLNDPDIGGRYSALSYFGLVPAALLGVDISLLLLRAEAAAERCRQKLGNPALFLGTAMGVLARSGRDKLTLILPEKMAAFGAWVEQLIAESTGKEGVGVLPVDGEELLDPKYYGPGRFFVHFILDEPDPNEEAVAALEAAGHPVARVLLDDLYSLGHEFFRWEFATAVAGAVLQVNPFDQPNVESAKVVAKQMVAAYEKEGSIPHPKPVFSDENFKVFGQGPVTDVAQALEDFLAKASPGDEAGLGRSYVAVQAFLPSSEPLDQALKALRQAIQKKTRLAVTTGYGPRFLHSTGQLHKGDAGHGLFLQLCHAPSEDVPIPDEMGGRESSLTFGVLEASQVLGDAGALANAGRTLLRLEMAEDAAQAIRDLTEMVSSTPDV